MKKHLPIIVGILLVILGVGCGREQLPTQNSNYLGTVAVDGRDGPHGTAEIVSAQLHFYVLVPNGQQTNAHGITAPWSEATVSWNSFAGGFSPDVEGSVTVGSAGWNSVDITALVNAWANGTIENYGVLLEQSVQAGAPVAMRSSESAAQAPFLEISYPFGGTTAYDTLYPSEDAFIDQLAPDALTGGNLTLLLGRMMMPNAEKQALFQFDLPEIFYEIQYSAIGGTVWNDLDEDGIMDGDEFPMVGVGVYLLDCSEAFLDSTRSGAAGLYRFDSLTAGEYYVRFVAPEGYSFSPRDQSTGDALDSDADPASGNTDCFSVAEGEESLTWFAGLFESNEVDPGCTQGLGYWKHLVSGLQVANMSEYLPLWLGANIGATSIEVSNATDVASVLWMKTYGDPSNGITKLYAHLLVAKLNIVAGAQPDDIAPAILQADAFLGLYDWTDWDHLTNDEKKTVLGWKDACEEYNEGVIGPGSCGELGNDNGDKAMK